MKLHKRVNDNLSLLIDLTNLPQSTDSEAGLFRSNSTYSRFLSAFARLHGYNYLRNLVQPLLDTMVAMPPGTGYEVDPSKTMGQDIIENQKSVEYVASTFLGLISSSLPALPGYDSFLP